MRIVFMGSPDFSVKALDALVSAGHDIVCVYAQPPRRAGRGKAERKTPVHLHAQDLGLEVRTPTNFKDPADIRDFENLAADIAVVVAYGLILPQSILDAPKRGCLNIHASLLPRWRGAAPIQRAIMSGDTQTGVCIMQMDAGLDTGPVLIRRETKVSALDTYATLHDRLALIGAEAVVDAIQRIDTITPEPQGEHGLTYAKKINKDEAHIDWTKDAQEIDRLIRGLSPFPGAWTELNGERLKFLMSEVVNNIGPAGTALDDQLTIAAGSQAVRILKLQRAGKKPADTQEVLRGLKVPTGANFR